MEDGRSIAYFAELGYNAGKPESRRNKSVRCSMFVGWYRLLCNGLLFGKRERQRGQYLLL